MNPKPEARTDRRKSRWLQRCVRLLLKSKTSKSRAEQICRAIEKIYPAKLCGERGKYEIHFRVAEDDTKHIWLMMLINDAKAIKSVKQPNDQKLSHAAGDVNREADRPA